MIWETIPIIGMVGGMTMTIIVVYLISKTRQRRLELQAEIQAKLIDRFSSAPELIQFLQSPTGREFVNGVQSVPAVLSRERVATGIGRAILLAFAALPFLGMAYVFEESGLLVPALIFGSLGIGYVVATWVSHRISTRFGLIEPQPPMPERREAGEV